MQWLELHELLIANIVNLAIGIMGVSGMATEKKTAMKIAFCYASAVLLLANHGSSSELLTKEDRTELRQGGVQRRNKLAGLHFTILAKHWVENYDKLRETHVPAGKTDRGYMEKLFMYQVPKVFRETWAMRHTPENLERPFQSRWVCYAPENPAEDWLKVRAFLIEDDKKLRRFARGDLTLCENLKLRSRNDFYQCISGTGEDFDRGWLSVQAFNLDNFGEIIGLVYGAIPFRLDPTAKITGGIASDAVQVIKSPGASYGKYESIKLKVDKVNSKSWAEVIPSPHFMVTRQEVLKDGECARFFRTIEVGEFEGILYPKKGIVCSSYSQQRAEYPMNHQEEFEVIEVRRLTDQDHQNWMLDFPAGSDYRQGDYLHVKEFPKEYKEEREQKFLSKMESESSSKDWILSTIAVVSICVTGVVFFWQRGKK